MPLMRSSFLLLVLANLAFFAWDRGYFGEPSGSSEAQRLKAQLNPEKIRIISTVKPIDPEACRIIGNLRLADAQALQSTLVQRLAPEVKVVLSQAPDATAYEVLISDLATHAAASNKLADLVKLGIGDAQLMTEDKGRFSLLLASFPNEAGARDYLQAHKGLKTAKVVTRKGAQNRTQLLVRGSERALARLPDLISGPAGAAVADCSAP